MISSLADMQRLVFVAVILARLIVISSTQSNFPSTPIEFRGLWCVSQWDNRNQSYSQQIGQAFFYNNESFSFNFLNDISYNWWNYFLAINQTDSNGTYQIFTDTTRGPSQYLNVTSCFWRRLLSNGDIIWGRQSNGTCTPSFEEDISLAATRYTRQNAKCRLFDDEAPYQELSTTSFESDLLRFDQSLPREKRQAIVFFGSSSIALWSTLARDFPTDVINRGFGGSTLKQCWQQFKRIILPLEPRALIVYAGENDIADGVNSTEVQSIFLQLIPTIRRFYSSLPIAYISIKPSPSRIDKLIQMNDTNNRIRNEIKNMNNIHYIDIFDQMLTPDNKPRPELFLSDNLHMNAEGYAIWTRAVTDYLKMKGLISKASMNGQMSICLTIVAFVLHFFI